MGTSFGRGGATTFQQDLANADCIVIEGSNMAECHPVGFQWVMEAKRRGATIIHVDPRFTRTSAVADLHVPLRAGTDIAFLGGLINHVIQNEAYFEEYVRHYTNANVIISEDYQDPEDLDGLFSGWDPDEGQYDPSSWQYVGGSVAPSAGQKEMFAGAASPEQGAGSGQAARGRDVTHTETDDSLQHPNCVFQILKRHFSRYTPEVVEDVCGIPAERFQQVAETLVANSGRDRTSAFCYAVGWTQHTVGVQYIRTASILQLLLGNIGRPGGGILALRGHASIQGSTDIPTLYNLLPGYLPVPHATHDTSLDEYVEYNGSATGYWADFRSYAVSLLKAYFGDAATPDNDFCYDHLPHQSGDHSHMTTVAAMADGIVEGYFIMGENPVVGSMHGALHRKAARNLKWCVVRDFYPTESAEFWRKGPEFDRGEARPEDCDTEVFFLPAAAHSEKDGAFTNTQRLLQWHEKAVEPPGDCRSELWFMYHLGLRLKERYAGSEDPKDRPIQDLTWDYPTQGPHDEPEAEEILAEISGWRIDEDGEREYLASYTELEPDGSTVAGCWIYTGAYADGVNLPARRKPWHEQNWIAHEWAWAWPDNRRILYNRASADPQGRPWSEHKRYVWWDEDAGEWTSLGDSVDFVPGREPGYEPPEDATGTDAIAGDSPFVMQSDGKGWMFVPTGLLDGPLPTHYEPQESPVENLLYGQQCNPARIEWDRPDNPYHRAFGDERFPYVLTTYRLTEHHTAGGMSRWLAWLSELQPELFCEISPSLAQEKGIENGGWATIRTARGEIEARVLVTERMQPLRIGRGGRHVIEQIGVPYHWSYVGPVTGDSINELIGFVADPNVSIQESKALTADIEAGRRSRGRRVVTSGPLFTPLDEDPDRLRDTDQVGRRPPSEHGVRAGQTQQTEET
ncbi:MAG: molybdopterin-dependent oxidoreductase [Actinobacteria bacterium]|nr:molybdopterin-dependent oxidoreductase [Actinomycetota bacterium]